MNLPRILRQDNMYISSKKIEAISSEGILIASCLFFAELVQKTLFVIVYHVFSPSFFFRELHTYIYDTFDLTHILDSLISLYLP